MLYNVPQYIDIEDKIAGPLTAKQLLWMFGMGGMLLMMWGFLDKTTFYIAAVPVVLIFSALAFYRPYGQPLINFVIYSIQYIMRPKLYFWNRETTHEVAQKKAQPEIVQRQKNAGLTEDKVKMFAQVLDSQGKNSNSKVIEYIKERQRNRKQ